MPAPDGRRPGRWRLGCAVAVSLLLHGAALWWLVFPASAVRVPVRPPRAAMEVLWIAAPPAAAQAVQPEPGDALKAAKPAAPLPGPAREARGGLSPPAPVLPAQEAGQGMAVIPMPLPAASDARDVPAVQWSPEGVARAARQEREWQRRHGGTPAAAALAANAASPAPRALGTLTAKEWQNAYAGRVTRVESEAGVYCVRLPLANRLPEQGAAPRIAAVTNCRAWFPEGARVPAASSRRS